MAAQPRQSRRVSSRWVLRGRTGTAAVEFALMAPVLSMLLLGTIELSNIMRLQAKLNIAAGQLVAMVAGQPAVVEAAASSLADKTGSLSDMCAGAALTMLPYDNTAMSANIASVSNKNSGAGVTPNLDWNTETSCQTVAAHESAQVIGNYSNLPSSLLTRDGAPWTGSNNADLVLGYSAIIVQVNYQYRNILPYFLSQYVALTAVAVAHPRSNATITCTTTPIGSANPVYCPSNP